MDAARDQPLQPKGHFSIARVLDAWYIACRSSELRDHPIAREILGLPIVLFRGPDARAVALLDRCAHRNVPLSLGRADGGRLACGYHGWTYDESGACQAVPSLCGVQTGKGRRVPHFASRERHGFVWVYASADVEPSSEPFSFPEIENRAYSTVRYVADLEATLHATLENILDVPHTAFLHRGLFRGVKRNEITAVVRRAADRVEAQYVGEPRPAGLVGALLAPGGGEVEHYDRFLLPSIAQVEYRLGTKSHLLINAVLTPVSDFLTRMYAVLTFRTPIPAPLLRAAVTPIGKRILKQDQVILRQQTERVRRFGGEQYVSTDVDLLGPHVWRLLRQAERGDKPGEPHEERVQLLA